MKKYLFIIIPLSIATVLTTVAFLFLISISSIDSQATTTSLNPLSQADINTTTTSSIPALEDLPVGLSAEEVHVYYLAKTKQIYGSNFTALSDQDIIGYGLLWCEAIELGMTQADVEERINEGAVDNDDAALQRSIVIAALLYLCPHLNW